MAEMVLKIDPEQQIDPALATVLQPIVAKWETAILRVAAAHAPNPSVVVPSLPGSTEEVLQAHFDHLDANRQRQAAVRADRQLQFTKRLARNGRHLDLTRLGDAVSVDALMNTPVAVAGTRRKLESIAAGHLRGLGLPDVGTIGPAFSLRSLRYELQRVVCIDETNGFLGSELGEDEIWVTGLALDGTTNIGQIGPRKIGDFDDGTRLDLPAAERLLFAFDLTAKTVYPQLYFVTIILVEKDGGNLNETIKDIINKVAKEAIDKISALIGGAIGSAGGPIGALIGIAVGWAVGKIVDALIRAWEDDLFEPRTLECIIPDASATMPPSAAFHVFGPGEYALRYQWRALRSRPQVVTSNGVTTMASGRVPSGVG